MDDLISRQAAKDMIKNHKSDFSTEKDYRTARACVNAVPPAQPEIIRCKDCKHFAGEGMYCSCGIIVQFDHFYCYHAERRQDV